MENIKCEKPGCRSTSFRKMYENSTGTSVKCNVCGRLFMVPKAKTASSTTSPGRTIYGDRQTYRSVESDYSYRRNDDDDRRDSYYSTPTYEAPSSNDSFGGGNSDGGGCSSSFSSDSDSSSDD